MSTKQNNTPPSGIALPIIRRAFPELLADKLVGVKPKTKEEIAKEVLEYAEKRAKWRKEMHKNEIKKAGEGWIVE